ncbi:Zinc finger C-x8-C-x5-C-x3-H type family protein [Prunus dulcis]|uniref:Zinc finger C-x8-C-x5-C-x3-H type family protein n=1 Tax=Prunus dulcis TaxID=3755 RepID=A0A4Y1RHB1_PRUDU|nr:Zinc finger C-x8-C-x5-C-x3-H type family protein [Prunus dulcis]
MYDHFWSGGRKDGRDGSFNPRSREPFAAPFVENFMGLPIRPGERDCPYYMRNLSCGYGASSSTAARWSGPRSLYNAPLIIPPSQGIPSRNTEHNGYQATETSMPAPPPYVFNHSVTETNAYEQYPQQQQVEELPQRPGQPVCIYFSTTGDCKVRTSAHNTVPMAFAILGQLVNLTIRHYELPFCDSMTTNGARTSGVEVELMLQSTASCKCIVLFLPAATGLSFGCENLMETGHKTKEAKIKHKLKEREGLAEKPGQTECKNYFRSGGQRQNRYAPQNPGDNDSFSPNSDVSPNPGNDGALPQNPGKDDILPPNHGDTDCDLATLREILRHKTALLGIIRKLDAGLFGIFKKSTPPSSDESEEEVEVSCGGPETEIRNENRYKTQSEERDGGGGENKNENGGEVQKKVDEERSRRHNYPVRPPGAGDSSHNLKTGTHQFGSNCKFNLTRRSKNNQVSKNKMKEREGLAEKPGKTECKVSKNKMKEREGLAEKPGKTECKVSKNKMKERKGWQRSQARQNARFSFTYIFVVKFVVPEKWGLLVDLSVSKNKMKEREGLAEKPGKTEFKSLGEKDCSCYMRTLSCMYGTKCRFNHPDPTPAGESDPPSGNGNGGLASLQGASSATAARWYAPISLNNAPIYEPIMIPPSQEFPSQNTEWNGYQAPERSMPAPPPYVMNHSVTETNTYEQYPQQKQVQEFPERPGQPVCLYFSRSGDCKHKSNCKYLHPKIRLQRPPHVTRAYF